MDSHVGLDYIVDNPDYCVKLASALDTACPSVKKQVVELLSALCVYSQDGRQRAIDTLHIHQERKGERYRLRVVVDELQKATAEDYQTALLAFINCLVISTSVLKDRIRIRNEFIGLKLLPILSELRKSHVPDLRVQLDVFDDQRENDEELSNHGPPGIDLSSHVDVFYAILGQIADTPQEIPFLSILQHLLRLDPKDPASDLSWDTAETLVHRATLLENREDVTKLLRSPSLQTNLCCHCRGTGDQTCGTRKASLPTTTPLPPPPPPPPLPSSGAQTKVVDLPSINFGSPQLPPPPPPPFILSNVSNSHALMDPPLPPPLNASPIPRASDPEPPSTHARLLPQQEIPTPKTKMKTINWNKIPNHKVVGKKNIWSMVANDHQNSPMADLDWAEMEGLFCQQVPPMLPPTTFSSSLGSVDADRRRREPTEIALLDGKRSLNVNIFLKQFRSSNEDIIQLIKDGGHDDIGAEKLRGLLKILPEVDELEMLKSFDGDKSKLGNAEKFFLQLIQVPNYKLRIECMLLKEEFAANMSYLEPSINSMILAGEDLMTNKPLQEVLYMVLVAGNFLNSGGYAGNAAGVKLSSLQKLTEIRANKPGMNLIHYVALQAERKRKDLLNFANGMTALEASTKTTIEQLNNEFNTLDSKIQKIKTQLQLASTENDIQEQMAQFLKMAEREMSQVKGDIEELEGVRRTLAEFFCEDANTFKIEECFRVFHQFCQKFSQAVAENERRRIQEEQIIARRKQREEQLQAKKRMLSNQAETPGSESECNLMDYGLLDLHTGLPQRTYNRGDVKIKRLQNGGVTSDEDVSITGSPNIRRRLGSCSGGPDQQSTKEDTYSPDITPNGTLRRRRSRIPCEDDDGNLMDFLRTTGQDNTRERKSWGSLDRSWARRARGQSRRGDLLNADFSGDRERASSPSPLAENKPFLQEEETKPTGKAWRQKIEAWLSENEKEDRAGKELQRRARQLHQNNRKSFEDSENESKNSILNNSTDDNSIHERYHPEVYDWRPSVEKTDVMRTMEAIEEAQPSSSQKDKSPWRKSSLNIPNTEETDPRYSRRLRSRLSTETALASSTLQAIREEERKKSLASDPLGPELHGELTIYLRQPSTTSQSSVTRRLSKLSKKHSEEDKISDKIEIDSDNIETPPATRRLFSPPKEMKPVEKEPCKRERCNSLVPSREPKVAIADLGPGNFDRYSATRRTRRYKKSQDPMDVIKSDIFIEEKPTSPGIPRPNSLALSINEDTTKSVDRCDGRDEPLKSWQDKLKHRENSHNDLQQLTTTPHCRSSRLAGNQAPPPAVVAVTNTVLSPVMQESKPREPLTILAERAITSRERHRSMIDPSQVKEAVRLANHPPSQVNQPIETVKSEDNKRSLPPVPSNSMFRSRFIPDINVTTSPQVSLVKAKEQELNDEGFEETQSLVSETLSQETSSGNYETDTHDSTRCSPAELRYNGTTSVRDVDDDVDDLDDDDLGMRRIRSSKNRQNTIDSGRRTNGDKTSLLPTRTSSVKGRDAIARKESSKGNTSLNSILLRNEVERSGSRSSLRSSRSSLNSATSVNTVRNLIPSTHNSHLRGYTSAIRALTSDLKKNNNTNSGAPGAPLPSGLNQSIKKIVNPNRTSNVVSRIPASRSSSSGSSSVGLTAIANRQIKKFNVMSRSSDEVITDVPKTNKNRPVVASRSSSSGSSVNGQLHSSGLESKTGSVIKSRLVQPRAVKNHSFMRPTTASVNKGSIPNLPRSVKNSFK